LTGSGTRIPIKAGDVDIAVSGSVYPPAEDSFLLAKHAKKLRGRVLDMCSGSGICALTNAKANPDNEVIGADVNPEAVQCATKNAQDNNIKNASFIQSDLFEKTGGGFDAILCNPPYLPDAHADQAGKGAEIALSGGKTGREFTDRFLEEACGHLNPGGTLLLIQSSINDLEKTMEWLKNKGFNAEVADQETFFFEKIFLVKIT
jgi:release factor glutamine methyltransferase